MVKIEITPSMLAQSKIEAKRRDPHIAHHFNVTHLSGEMRDCIGFLGEFACCQFFNIDWTKNIRDNYLTIDSFDLIIKGKKIDVKTETLPMEYLLKILNHSISDNGLYGRRLIHEGQVPLLTKYDIVIFGAFPRDVYTHWYPLGYLHKDFIVSNYKPTNQRPDGGKYPFSAMPIRTSELKPLNDLK